MSILFAGTAPGSASAAAAAARSAAGSSAAAAAAALGQNHVHHHAHHQNAHQMAGYGPNPMQSWLLSHSAAAAAHHHPSLNATINHQSQNANDPRSAFGSNPFGLSAAHAPHPASVPSYDSSGFLPNPFQTAKPSYLQTASGFYKAMAAKEGKHLCGLFLLLGKLELYFALISYFEMFIFT